MPPSVYNYLAIGKFDYSNHDSVFHLHKFGPTSFKFLCCPPKDEAIVILRFPTISFPSAESSGLSVSPTHLNVGVIAGCVIGILFILGDVATIVGINLAICLYIAARSKRRTNPAPSNIITENSPILLSLIKDEVDKPSDTPPVSTEEKSGEEENLKSEAAMEKEREAMEEEGEQRYQPQEAIIAAP
jgi:hypothetical protein